MVVRGLSPRVRGNQLYAPLATLATRSIPAGAGEPVIGSGSGNPGAVYPRGCGGTNVAFPIKKYDHGLSPRVRGNHGSLLRHHHGVGSIPAGAGEPLVFVFLHDQLKVYPRGCGGTC